MMPEAVPNYAIMRGTMLEHRPPNHSSCMEERTAMSKSINPMNAAPDSVALYARVSTEEQAENDTVAAQLDFLRSLAGVFTLQVAGEYVDEGISGTIPLDGRPDGQRLLADAEAGR